MQSTHLLDTPLIAWHALIPIPPVIDNFGGFEKFGFGDVYFDSFHDFYSSFSLLLFRWKVLAEVALMRRCQDMLV